MDYAIHQYGSLKLKALRILDGFPPNGLLTLEDKHDVDNEPYIIAPDPLLTDDSLNALPSADLFLLTTTEELKMNASEDEPLPGLNGRLRPRRSQVSSPQNKARSKSESKTSQERSKRISTPSKASPNKQNDLADKSDFSHTPQFLCPYCEKKFVSKQTVSKHVRRMHFSSSRQDIFLSCLFCNQTDADANIIRHMVDSHPNQYFACLDCHTRFPSTSELAEHKLNVCEKQKVTYRTKPRRKVAGKTKKPKAINVDDKYEKHFQGHGFNGIVISCELKPAQVHDGADIEDNIPTNLILPPSKNLGNNAVIEKNAVIVLDDIQWNKRIPPNFAFHNTDADQILSRLGVVHRSPRTSESTRKDWIKNIDDSTQKFERCFDTKFYSTVASNVQENLNKFLDGSFNFNPDPDAMIKTRKSNSSVPINTAEGFPILLASEQFSRGIYDKYLPRATAPKHKWKWENSENDKVPMTPDEIKRDSHTNNCIVTLMSSLDIWTQLSMRRRYEDKFNSQPIAKKTEKQNIISKELKDILESREIPKHTQVVTVANRPTSNRHSLDFPASLGLAPATPTYNVQPAVLSGEWVRPRCYVCCACGEKTMDPKDVTSHISVQHPYAQVQHYEIVGESLLNADILKHLYVPPSQVSNRTRPPRGFRECTKCNKSVTLEDLHQHMLDCAGDTPAVRRRQGRSRPFGVRKRRPRMPENTIRTKIRKNIRSRRRLQKSRMLSSRPRNRSEVGDAETIRKMLTNLPPKRRRTVISSLDATHRPRRRLNPARVLKKPSEESKNGQKRINKDGAVNKKTLSVDDEEDNVPLKPKVKKLIHMTKRREALRRQVAINKVKRRSVRVEQRKNIESECLNSIGIEEASADKTPERVDIKRGASGSREHGNRGTTNNRDNQRAGCSGTHGTTNNNTCPPAQTVPLKHSIARLTANSETHDKSVQFHSLFLVQQECNNTNQHDPTEQHTLFENEAVVSKLDKPPLNFCQKGLLDLQALQKSKLNKPRKGLNDCIAMLKNKLVDPVSLEETGHVSVQCGTDEPIELYPEIIAPTVFPRMSKAASAEPDTSQNEIIHINPAEDLGRQESYNVALEYSPVVPQNVQKNEVQVKRRSRRGKQVLRTDEEHLTKKMTHSPVAECYFGSATTKDTRLPEKVRPRVRSQSTSSQSMVDFLNDPKRRSMEAFAESLRFTEPPATATVNELKQRSADMYTTTISANLLHSTVNVNDIRRNSIEAATDYVPSMKISPKSKSLNDTVRRSNNAYTDSVTMKPPAPVIGVETKRRSIDIHNGNEIHMTSSEIAIMNDTIRRSTKHYVENVLGFKPAAASLPVEDKRRRSYDTYPENVMTKPSEVVPNNITKRRSGERYTDRLTLFKSSAPSLSVNDDAKQRPTEVITVMDKKRRSTEIYSDKNLKPSPAMITNDTKRQFIEAYTESFMNAPAVVALSEKSKRRSIEIYGNTVSGIKPLASPMALSASEQRYIELFNVNATMMKPPGELTVNETKRCSIEAGSEPLASDPIISWQKPRSSKISSDIYEHNLCEQPQRATVFMDTSSSMNQLDQRQESELNPQTYICNEHIEIPDDIPPAHTRTKVEPILPTPLDLSTKVFGSRYSRNIKNYTRHYDTYETLDLSNKSVDKRLETEMDENVVVDLRVKPMQLRAPQDTLDVCINPNNSIGMSVAMVENYPKDLSIRGKDTPNIADKLNDTNMLRDLSSSSKISITETSFPTDLSARSLKDAIPQETSTKIQVVSPVVAEDTQIESSKGIDILPAHVLPVKSTGTQPKTAPPITETIQNHASGCKKSVEIISLPCPPPRVSDGLLMKSAYEPTLKIPQYRICDDSPDMPLSMAVTNDATTKKSTTSPKLTKETTCIHQSLSVSLENKPVYTSISAQVTYTVTDQTSTSVSNIFESTTPVYTVTDACTSATTIDTPHTNTVTNVLLSIPGSKIESNKPVYTLAGTTLLASVQYSAIPGMKLKNNVSNCSSQGDSVSQNNNGNSLLGNVVDAEKETVVRDVPIGAQDPETAKKIAMLPKELVEILGNMPVDHRNQLLNVLPQYVSPSVAVSMTLGVIEPTATPSSLVGTKHTATLDKMATVETEDRLCLANIVPPPLTMNQVPENPFTSASTSENPDINKSRLTPTVPISDIPLDKSLGVDISLSSRDCLTEETTKTVVTSMANIVEQAGPSNRVIDLTEEHSSLKVHVAKIEEITPRAITFPSPEICGGITIGKPIKLKSNSDQTASLRAVRIKAPAERQKESLLLQRASIEQVPNINQIESDDNEFNRLSESHQSLAIQQAEISSTQHKNAVANRIYIASILPLGHEPSAEEREIKSQSGVFIAANNVEAQKENSQESVKENISFEPSVLSSELGKKVMRLESPNKISDNNASEKSVDALSISTETSSILNNTNSEVAKNKKFDSNKEHSKDCMMQDQEDDSEDDMILAAIVKKKHKIETKCDKGTNNALPSDNKRTRVTKKKKNENKLKRISASDKAVKKEVTSNPDITDVLNNDAEQSEITAEELNSLKPDNNDFKHKLEKDSKTIDIIKNVIDNSNISVTGRVRQVPTDHIEIEDTQEVTSEKTSACVSVPKCPSDDKIYIDQLSNVKLLSKNKIQLILDKKANNLKENNPYNTATEPIQKSNISDDDESERVIIDDKTKTGDVSQEHEYAKDTDIKTIQSSKSSELVRDIVISREVEENVSDKPLRRSRRGKSLFVDGFFLENEEINPDNSLKAPLTKKQLIFSKLLNEENQSKSQVAVSEVSNVHKPDSDKDVNNLKNEAISIDHETPQIKTGIKKGKSIKRKKPQQSKTKLKKKKSEITTQVDDKSTGDTQTTKPENVVGYSTNDNLERNKDDLSKNVVNQIDERKSNIPENKDVNDNKSSHAMSSSLKEKRRLVHASPTTACTQSSKPKKLKLSGAKEIDEFDENDENRDHNLKNLIDSPIIVDKRITCYNKPIAARRTRSKSVGVSSLPMETYDPYDIDLDETIEKSESKKSDQKPKDVKSKSKSRKYAIAESDSETDTNKKPDRSGSTEDKEPSFKKSKKSASATVTSNKKNQTVKSSEIDSNKTSPTRKGRQTKTVKTSKHFKENDSDSDESSRSDVPLKKYVDEKARKLSETARSDRKSDDLRPGKRGSRYKSKALKKDKRRVEAESHDDDSAGVSQETEEQLRSEQFMESFGFFSERKPRKSNLLASKKISETFHIIANETEDVYFDTSERTSRRTTQTESRTRRQPSEETPQPSTSRRRRTRKKRIVEEFTQVYCDVCKKEFRRPDNFIRHKMSASHILKVAEVDLGIPSLTMPEEPNYLLAYQVHLDRFQKYIDEVKRNKKGRVKIVRPTVEEVWADIENIIREQEQERRGYLSTDEALFVDCCELLKESHITEIPKPEFNSFCTARNCSRPSTSIDFEYVRNNYDSKSDGDVDSITARNILESEEVRNLENDLISGLKEAAEAYQRAEAANAQPYRRCCATYSHPDYTSPGFISPDFTDSHSTQTKLNEDDFDMTVETDLTKTKKYPEYKDKMYPDIEEIDMFEDKFDKIKRKCRSQAAAAKQAQTVVKPTSKEGRKKADKKKTKKISKKSNQNTVLTKGALKGFDGVKESIPTSDIIVSSSFAPEGTTKKKKKAGSKKKKEKKDSDTSCDYRSKEGSTTQKKVDVYEFMDNEDAELFEFRPSTLMERFKNITYKEETKDKESKEGKERKEPKESEEPKKTKEVKETKVSSTKINDHSEVVDTKKSGKIENLVEVKKQTVIEIDEQNDTDELNNLKDSVTKQNTSKHESDIIQPTGHSPTSVSDGDDFVYMSDDYLCSETEVDVPSEMNTKKKSKAKGKATLEKSAVMGKIFKNAARTERKTTKKETVKPKANLDQLFDSLLEEKPSLSSPQDAIDSSKQGKLSEKIEEPQPSTSECSTSSFSRKSPIKDDCKRYGKCDSSLPVRFQRAKSPSPPIAYSDSDDEDAYPTIIYNIPLRYQYNYGASTSKQDSSIDIYGPSTSKMYDYIIAKDCKALTPKNRESITSKKNIPSSRYSSSSSLKDDEEQQPDFNEETTKPESPVKDVDKSYDFNFDDDAGVARQRARRKCTVGKQNVLAETWSSESEPDGLPPRPNSAESTVMGAGRKKKGRKKDSQQSCRRGKVGYKKQDLESRGSSNRNTGSGISDRNIASDKGVEEGGGGGSRVRPRATAGSFWQAEGDAEQEHQQQHGWIVGDSHKKLVTMLAHAKGRKRNDDKHLVE